MNFITEFETIISEFVINRQINYALLKLFLLYSINEGPDGSIVKYRLNPVL